MACRCVEELVERVAKLRRREMTIDTDSLTVVLAPDRHAWAKVFVEYFLSSAHCALPRCACQSSDDMLWYVQALAAACHKARPALDVFRRQSRKQPAPGSKAVGWEETVYLNLLLHHVDYTLTCAVCTKTSPHNLQILRKHTQRILPSPSRRRMDVGKGEAEELAYPLLYFTIDDYLQAFGALVVRDGECVCVELAARDRARRRESVVFLGSIRYEVLRQVYDAKGSGAWHWAQKLVVSSASPASARLEFVRMRGPRGKGFAEMAVRQARCAELVATLPAPDEHLDTDPVALQAASDYALRRQSDTNLAGRQRGGGLGWAGAPLRKVQSEADTSAGQLAEVEANSLDDELDESALARLWTVRGFGQAWHWLRERRRQNSTPLNALLTYVTLPWTSVAEDLFDSPVRPILTFDADLPPS